MRGCVLQNVKYIISQDAKIYENRGITFQCKNGNFVKTRRFDEIAKGVEYCSILWHRKRGNYVPLCGGTWVRKPWFTFPRYMYIPGNNNALAIRRATVVVYGYRSVPCRVPTHLHLSACVECALTCCLFRLDLVRTEAKDTRDSFTTAAGIELCS